tara:strand:+ start:603 stop:830 length:228 start_codon:yes stop_codon:yes gene_type:complete
MSESKSERFQRIAKKRVSKAGRALRLVGNLGNKALYESTEKERKVILKYLDDAYKQMKKDLESKKQIEVEDFDFE